MRSISWLMGAILLGSLAGFADEISGTALDARVERTLVRDLGVILQTSQELRVLPSGLRLPDHIYLRVGGVHAAAAQANTWLVRLECESRVECVPFEVLLRMRTGHSPAFALPAPATDRAALSSSVVRPGQRVQLAEEISGIHLIASGICLQAGSLGQRIRVRNVATGRVVLARVRSSGAVAVED